MIQELGSIMETGSIVMISILAVWIVGDSLVSLKRSEEKSEDLKEFLGGIWVTGLILLALLILMFIFGFVVEVILEVIQ